MRIMMSKHTTNSHVRSRVGYIRSLAIQSIKFLKALLLISILAAPVWVALAQQSTPPSSLPKCPDPGQCFATQAAKDKWALERNCQFEQCSDSITSITTDVLAQIFNSSAISQASLAAIASELNQALSNAAIKGMIDTKRKLAHFLAQIKQEVGPNMRLEEDLNYSASNLLKFSYFRRNPQEAQLYGRTSNQPANQQAIANRIYANRIGNGNVASGDGWKFRGRGMIQLTGRANYASFTREHNKIWGGTTDFIQQPDLLLQENYAVRSALVFWKLNGLDAIASQGVTQADSDNVTRKINSGTDSYAARYRNLQNIMTMDFFKECVK
jgi:predicted chitinase